MIVFVPLIVFVVIRILQLFSFVIITAFVIKIAWNLFWDLKALYVLKNIDEINRIEVSEPKQTYIEQREKVGESVGYYYTQHYKIRYIPNIKIWKTRVFFKNGHKMIFRMREYSKVYNEILKRI